MLNKLGPIAKKKENLMTCRFWWFDELSKQKTKGTTFTHTNFCMCNDNWQITGRYFQKNCLWIWQKSFFRISVYNLIKSHKNRIIYYIKKSIYFFNIKENFNISKIITRRIEKICQIHLSISKTLDFISQRSELLIFSINCQCVTAHNLDFNNTIVKNSTVLILSETLMSNEEPIEIPNFNSIVRYKRFQLHNSCHLPQRTRHNAYFKFISV